MTVIISQDGQQVTNTVSVSGPPAVRITGNNVRYTNSDTGRIISDAVGQPAIQIEGSGTTLVNEAGGVIRLGLSDYSTTVLRGSDHVDTVENYGLISGHVMLGEGNDVFRQSGTVQGYVSLEGGDDRFEMNAVTNTILVVDGGTGSDTAVLNRSGMWGLNFEHLIVGRDATNIVGFSGLQSLTMAPGGYYNFAQSYNPGVDLTLAGGYISVVNNSEFGKVIGGEGADTFELSSGAHVKSVSLGGGDDEFRLTAHSFFTNGSFPLIDGIVDGGSGNNRLGLEVDLMRTVDMRQFVGFSVLNTGTYSSLTSEVRLIHADGYKEITGDTSGYLLLDDSNSPDARVSTSWGGTVELTHLTTIGSVGYGNDALTPEYADDRMSITIINNGTIMGAVSMYIGDDVYDGSLGTAGGPIRGFSGNDTLRGGANDDLIEGGNGSDRLYGGGGADTLLGGAGNDFLDGGAGIDRVIYAGLFHSYSPITVGGVTTLTGATAEGADTLTGMEYVAFKDGTLVADPDSVGAQIIRLYDVVFQRAPDVGALDFYVDHIVDRHATLGAVAADLIGSSEFQNATGTLSNAQFVDYVYQHALDRAPDAGGAAYYAQRLDAGMTRGAFLVELSESAEHRLLTADAVASGYFDTDDVYQSVALLYDSFLDRLPDAAGLTFYAEKIKGGAMSLNQVATSFAGSAEFVQATAGMGHAELVDYAFENTLDRPADPQGRAYYLDQLSKGMSTNAFFQELALSQEHYALMITDIGSGIHMI